MGIAGKIIGLLKKRETFHVVAVLCIAYELVEYLFAGIKTGSVLQLNNHQISYTVYLLINVIALQSSYIVSARMNWLIISFCLTSTAGFCVYLIIEKFTPDFVYASAWYDLYYYASNIPSTLLFVPFFWYFREFSESIVYKTLLAFEIISLTTTSIFVINSLYCLMIGKPEDSFTYEAFMAFSIGMYTLYSMVMFDFFIGAYAKIFKKSTFDTSSYLQDRTNNI